MPEEKKYFNIEGTTVEIPQEELGDFMKNVPNAVEVKPYVIDQDTLAIPLDEVDEFIKNVPNAKPLFNETELSVQGEGVKATKGAVAGSLGKFKAEPTKSGGSGSAIKGKSVELQSQFPSTLTAEQTQQTIEQNIPQAEMLGLDYESITEKSKGKTPIEVLDAQAREITDPVAKKEAEMEVYKMATNTLTNAIQQMQPDVDAYDQALKQQEQQIVEMQSEYERLLQQDPQSAELLQGELNQLIDNHKQGIEQYNSMVNEYNDIGKELNIYSALTPNSLTNNESPMSFEGKSFLEKVGLMFDNPESQAYKSAWNTVVPSTLSTLAGVFGSSGIEGSPRTPFAGLSNKLSDSLEELSKDAVIPSYGKAKEMLEVSVLDDLNPYNVNYLAGGIVSTVLGTMSSGAFGGNGAAQLFNANLGFGGMYSWGREAGLDKQQAALMAIPVAFVYGYLGDKGVESLSGLVGKESFKKAIIEGIKEMGTTVTPKKVGELFVELIKKEGKNMLVGGGKEFLQEGVEYTSEFGSKVVASKVFDIKPEYEAELNSDAFVKGLKENAIVGGVSGMALSPIIRNVASRRNLSDLVAASSQDIKVKEKFVSDLNTLIASGQVSKEDAQVIIQGIERAEQTNAKVPKTVTNVEARGEAIDLIQEKEELTQEVETIDPAMAKPMTDRIASIDQRLQDISEGKVESEPKGIEQLKEEIDLLDDNQVVTTSVNTIDEVPQPFRERARKSAMKGTARKSFLGIPYGNEVAVSSERYTYTATGKELKDYVNSQLKPEDIQQEGSYSYKGESYIYKNGILERADGSLVPIDLQEEILEKGQLNPKVAKQQEGMIEIGDESQAAQPIDVTPAQEVSATEDMSESDFYGKVRSSVAMGGINGLDFRIGNDNIAKSQVQNWEENRKKYRKSKNPFTYIFNKNGKRYLVAIAGLNDNIGEANSGRDGSVYTYIEITENIPASAEELLLKKAIERYNEEFKDKINSDSRYPAHEFKPEYLSGLLKQQQKTPTPNETTNEETIQERPVLEELPTEGNEGQARQESTELRTQEESQAQEVKVNPYKKYNLTTDSIYKKYQELSELYAGRSIEDALRELGVDNVDFDAIKEQFYNDFISKELPSKLPTIKNRFGIDNLPQGEVKLKPITKPEKVVDAKTTREKSALLKDIVGDDDLRPVTTGVFNDSKNKKLVATNSFVLISIKDTSIKEDAIISPKTGQKIDGKFPNYEAVIPKENPIKQRVSVSEILGIARAANRASQFFGKKDERGILVSFKIGDDTFLFSAKLMEDVFTFLAKLGKKNVTIEMSAPNRAAVINDGDVTALIMPIMGNVESEFSNVNIITRQKAKAEIENQQKSELAYIQSKVDDRKAKVDQARADVRNAKTSADLNSANFDLEYQTERYNEALKELSDKKSDINNLENPLQEQEDINVVTESINNGEITEEQAASFIKDEQSSQIESIVKDIESKAESENEIEIQESVDSANNILEQSPKETAQEVDPFAKLEDLSQQLVDEVQKDVTKETKEIVKEAEKDGFEIPAEPERKKKQNEAQTDFEDAIKNLKDKFGDYFNQNLGISFDPRQEAQKLYNLHAAIVRAARAAIRLGINDINQFAQSIGKKYVDRFTKRAWNDAVLLENGQPAIINNADQLMNEVYQDVAKMYQEQREDAAKAEKSLISKIIKGIQEGIFEKDYVARRMLKRIGAWKPLIEKTLLAGASSSARATFDIYRKQIFGGLSKAEKSLLNDIIQARTIISIDERFDANGKKRPAHPKGTTMEAQKVFLGVLEQSQKKLYDKLNDRADKYFEANRELLKERLDEGRITIDQYNAMIGNEYSPRVFLKYLLEENLSSGTKLALEGAGIDIKSIEDGDVNSLFHDAEWLLSTNVLATNKAVFNNRANRSLYNVAVNDPNNGLIQIQNPIGLNKTTGQPLYPDAPLGFSKMGYYENGVLKSMIVPNDFYNSWSFTEPLMNPSFANAVRIATGGVALRMFATGVNPKFALTNFPRDISHTLFFTNTYSPVFPVALAQMSLDLAKTFIPAIRLNAKDKNGRYYKYLKEGGGMDFLSIQGKPFENPSLIKSGFEKGVDALSKTLGFFNERSEVWVRLAIRERAINRLTAKFIKDNGRNPTALEQQEISREGTFEAREQMDFSKGGRVTKAIDNVIPYFSAAIQGLSVAGKYINNNPKLFAFKLAQAAGVIIALMLHNKEYEDDYEDIPDEIKARYFIYMLPNTIQERGVTKRPYIRIPKTQSVQPFTTLIESMAEYSFYNKVPSDKTVKTMGSVFPVPNPQDIPLVNAMNTYESNYDRWTNRAVYRGAEYIPDQLEYFEGKTPYLWIDMAQSMGLSPERLKEALGKVITDPDNNIYTVLAARAYDHLRDKLPENKRKEFDEVMQEEFQQFIKPFGSAFIGYTNPNSNKKSVAEVEEKVRGIFKLQSDTVDQFVVDYLSGEKPLYEAKAEFNQWLRTQNKDSVNIDNLRNKFDFSVKFKDVDNVFWKMKSARTSQGKAELFYAEWLESSEDKRRELEKTAVFLGLVPKSKKKDFWKEFNRLKKGAE